MIHNINKLPSNEEIVEGFRNSHDKTIQSCGLFIFPSINSYVIKNSGQIEDSKELLNDVLLIFQSLCQNPDFQIQQSFKGLLMDISRKRWIDKLRKNKIVTIPLDKQSLLLDDKEEYEEENKPKENLLEIVYRNIEIIDKPADCKELLRLIYQEKAKHKNILAYLRLPSINAVSKRKNSCLNKLRQLLLVDLELRELAMDFDFVKNLVLQLNHRITNG